MTCRLAGLCLLVLVSVCCAGEERETVSPAAASNAPLSLAADALVARDGEATGNLQPKSDAASAITSGSASLPAADSTDTPKSSSLAMLNQTLGSVGRDGQASGTGAASAIQSVPWYRGGLFSLVVVLAVIAGIALLLKRLVPAMRVSQNGAIDILSRNAIGPKQTLALVRMGRRVVLLGVTSDRVNMLCEVSDPVEVAELVGSSAGVQRHTASESFGDMLATEAEGFDDQIAGSGGRGASASTTKLAQAKGSVGGLLAKLKNLQQQETSR